MGGFTYNKIQNELLGVIRLLIKHYHCSTLGAICENSNFIKRKNVPEEMVQDALDYMVADDVLLFTKNSRYFPSGSLHPEACLEKQKRISARTDYNKVLSQSSVGGPKTYDSFSNSPGY